MATLTTRPKLAVVNIVSLVTGKTGTWRTVDNLDRLSVTAITVYVFVLAIQFKLRLAIMVEPPDFPTVGCMTAVAILPQFAFVGIILFVAGIAFN
jgi:hypothetical protein